MFIDDVEAGDLWYFPAGFPHSIQDLKGDGPTGVGPAEDGSEFLLGVRRG
jgi:oxalate decarboxylase